MKLYHLNVTTNDGVLDMNVNMTTTKNIPRNVYKVSQLPLHCPSEASKVALLPAKQLQS